MNFIETLKNIDSVKTCDSCNGSGKEYKKQVDAGTMAEFMLNEKCWRCKGTGQILDLVPLLTKPKKLANVVDELMWLNCDDSIVRSLGDTSNLHVVGPQRASNLIYEVASQLGGTAVVCFPVETILVGHPAIPKSLEDMKWVTMKSVKLSLSLPISPDTTVLFVTDQFDEEEMKTVVGCVKKRRLLPYILCLVSGAVSKTSVEGTEPWIVDSNEFEVISLHCTKPL
jgi:hypothetical protein